MPKKPNNTPKLGGDKRLNGGEPALSKEWEAFREIIELSLSSGDIDPILLIGKNTVPYLIVVVKDKSRDRWERLHAALALGQLQDDRAIRPLGDVLLSEVALRDSDMLVLEVADALRQFRDRQARQLLTMAGFH